MRPSWSSFFLIVHLTCSKCSMKQPEVGRGKIAVCLHLEIHQNDVKGKWPLAPLPLEEKTLLHGQRVSRGHVNPERGCGDLTRSRQTESGRESDCDTLLSQRPGRFSKDAVLGRWIPTSRTCRGVGVSQGREELGRHSSLRLP